MGAANELWFAANNPNHRERMAWFRPAIIRFSEFKMYDENPFQLKLSNEEQLKRKRKQAIKDALETSSIPVSDNIRNAVASLFVTDALDVLRAHPGFDLEDHIRSIRSTLQLFDQAFADLTDALETFSAFSRRAEFSYRSHRTKHDAIERRIRKEIFAFSELAHCLQDHSRHIKSRWASAPIASRISICFGDDGMHEFICGLRSALHHHRMLDANWELRGSGLEATSQYVFKRCELLDAEKAWNKLARRYLTNVGEKIDIGAIAPVYHQRVHNLYDALLVEADCSPPAEVEDYRVCWLAHRRRSTRMSFAVLLNVFQKQRIDPYDHLNRLLDPSEIEAVLQFAKHSREQVDFIIECIDEYSAFDEALRTACYEFFGVINV